MRSWKRGGCILPGTAPPNSLSLLVYSSASSIINKAASLYDCVESACSDKIYGSLHCLLLMFLEDLHH